MHLHSTCSDGQFAPAEVVRQAVAAGLKAIALTDHDTVDGIEEAAAAAPPGFEVIPGAELSSHFRGREIHLLAYHLELSDGSVREWLSPYREERRDRVERMLSRLADLGLSISFDEVLEAVRPGGAGPMSLGRPHVAEALVRRGYADDMDDAFRKYLRRGQPAWVPRAAIPVEEAIERVHAGGGAIVIAHAALNLSRDEVDALAGSGIDGIEVHHPKHTEEQRSWLGMLARRHRLLETGGSDYHGPDRSRNEMGAAGVPLATAAMLRSPGRPPGA